jgi:hypothetical protein
MSATGTRLPSAFVVAQAWLSEVVGIPADRVASTLPDVEKWATTGFVTVSSAGGSPHPALPVLAPVVTLACWWANPASARPQLGKAAGVAALIEHAAVSPLPELGALSTRDPYRDVRLLEARMIQHPTEVPGDPSGYARYDLDVMLTWALAPAAATPRP